MFSERVLPFTMTGTQSVAPLRDGADKMCWMSVTDGERGENYVLKARTVKEKGKNHISKMVVCQ